MKKNKTSFFEKMDIGGYYLNLTGALAHGALGVAAVVWAATSLVFGVPGVGLLAGLAAGSLAVSGMMLVMANNYDRDRQRHNPLRPQPVFYELTAAAGSLARLPVRGLSRVFGRTLKDYFNPIAHFRQIDTEPAAQAQKETAPKRKGPVV